MITNETRLIDLTVAQLQQVLQETITNSQSSQQIQPEQDIVPIDEAIKITNLARQTIYGLVYDRKIPFIKRPKSRKLYFSRKALLAWIQEEEK